MQYKLLLLDIDGTLRPYSSPVIPEENVKAIRAVQALGVKVAIATGRGRHAVSRQTLNGMEVDYWICSAGGQILDSKDRELFSDRMPMERLEPIVQFCQENDYPLFFYRSGGNYLYRGQKTYESRKGELPFLKVTGFDPDEAHCRADMPFSCFAWLPESELPRFWAQYPQSDLKFYFYHQGKYCDIMQPHVNKAYGLDKLLELTGTGLEESVFVGDGINDIDLLRHAGLSFAMADGEEEAKAAAQRICPPSVEFGVAAVCRELWGI